MSSVTKTKNGMFAKQMKYFGNRFREEDNLAPTIGSELHFEEDQVQKTYVGASLSILIYAFMIYTVITQGLLMLNNLKPGSPNSLPTSLGNHPDSMEC